MTLFAFEGALSYNAIMSKSKVSVVEESEEGTYVWRMPNGQWAGDDKGRFMNIYSRKGDLSKLKALHEVAKSYGITEGAPIFLSGKRPVSDDEYQEQIRRMKFGLVPDPLDMPALREEATFRKNG